MAAVNSPGLTLNGHVETGTCPEDPPLLFDALVRDYDFFVLLLQMSSRHSDIDVQLLDNETSAFSYCPLPQSIVNDSVLKFTKL